MRDTQAGVDQRLYQKLKIRTVEAKRVATRLLHANNAGVVDLSVRERAEMVEIATARYVSAPQKQAALLLWLRCGTDVRRFEAETGRQGPARTRHVDRHLDALVAAP